MSVGSFLIKVLDSLSLFNPSIEAQVFEASLRADSRVYDVKSIHSTVPEHIYGGFTERLLVVHNDSKKELEVLVKVSSVDLPIHHPSEAYAFALRAVYNMLSIPLAEIKSAIQNEKYKNFRELLAWREINGFLSQLEDRKQKNLIYPIS